MTKQEIREEYLEKRKNLSIPEYEELNEDISNHLREFLKEIPSHAILASFFPIASKKEVNTILFHQWMRDEPHKFQIALPKTFGEEMNFYLFEEKSILEKSGIGVMEPVEKNSQLIAPEKIDLILVPLIAVDIRGHRVGYGKGFYDRYLKRLTSKTRIVGLSLDLPIEPISDIGNHDFPLEIVITPHGIHKFN